MIPLPPPPRTIIGIDPSLSATGIAVLRHDGEPAHWCVVSRATCGAPAKGQIAERLLVLSRDFEREFMAALLSGAGPGTALVVAEDPADFRVPGKGGPMQRFRFGQGVGVVMATAARVCMQLGVPLETYGTKQWLPMQGGRRGGGWRYHVPHQLVVHRAQQLIPGLEGATDDETMAAALAFWRATIAQLPVTLKTRRRRSA